jgi:hypothetical protein
MTQNHRRKGASVTRKTAKQVPKWHLSQQQQFQSRFSS